jgi:hypothetical protein
MKATRMATQVPIFSMLTLVGWHGGTSGRVTNLLRTVLPTPPVPQQGFMTHI